MWIERERKKEHFTNDLKALENQVLLVRGARQVGKTSFILNALHELNNYNKIYLNLLYPSNFTIGNIEYLGRDFWGSGIEGEDFLKNLELKVGYIRNLLKPVLIFIDEVDRFPMVMEAIQTIALFSDKLKFVFTGSNLENIQVKNAATGRKKYFDLYPITFREFLKAAHEKKILEYINSFSFENQRFSNQRFSEYFHNQSNELLGKYIRLGGMPKLLDIYLDSTGDKRKIEEYIKDISITIEENIKTVLGERTKLYEYEDILRKIAFLSMNTLKFSHLQVQHAGRQEAKRLVSKTVGGRVIHKIRLFDSEKDLSKYIIFDCGIANYLINGADLLGTKIPSKNLAIMYETFVGNEIISGLVTRDDLYYWKSGNMAEVEYVLKSPSFIGIDVKTNVGDNKSLNSFALLEEDASHIIKIGNINPSINKDYLATLPNSNKTRKIVHLRLPHYLSSRISELSLVY